MSPSGIMHICVPFASMRLQLGVDGVIKRRCILPRDLLRPIAGMLRLLTAVRDDPPHESKRGSRSPGRRDSRRGSPHRKASPRRSSPRRGSPCRSSRSPGRAPPAPPRRSPSRSPRGSQICYDLKLGRCNRGSGCKFSHNLINKFSISKESGICFYYAKGSCTRGDKCPYKHIKPSAPAESTNVAAPAPAEPAASTRRVDSPAPTPADF